jgi:hypothetical protein
MLAGSGRVKSGEPVPALPDRVGEAHGVRDVQGRGGQGLGWRFRGSGEPLGRVDVVLDGGGFPEVADRDRDRGLPGILLPVRRGDPAPQVRLMPGRLCDLPGVSARWVVRPGQPLGEVVAGYLG